MIGEADAVRRLDLKKELCDCPLVNTHEALKSLQTGEVLEVITDHLPAAKDTIPRFCEHWQCPVKVSRDGDLWRILIKKGEGLDREHSTALRPKLEIKGLSKGFRTLGNYLEALVNINLSVAEGEFVCIVGPSGCGKSTMLNLIAGFDRPDGGGIISDGLRVDGPSRDRAVIFQEHALFPWLTVIKNVEFGLKMKGIGRDSRRDRARELLRMVHLSRFENNFIHELSGGMKQRVALARALAIEPRILLMDEPFTALDAQTRHLLHLELQEIWLATQKTFLFVTHNVCEAVSLADRVVVMSARPGRIKKEYHIDLARPRDDNNHLVSQVTEKITAELRSEIEKVAREELDEIE